MNYFHNCGRYQERPAMKQPQYSTVLRIYDDLHNLIEKVEFDSPTKAGATQRANNYLNRIGLQPKTKLQLGDNEYWTVETTGGIEP